LIVLIVKFVTLKYVHGGEGYLRGGDLGVPFVRVELLYLTAAGGSKSSLAVTPLRATSVSAQKNFF
jgi:hypothetical protein